MKTLRYLLFSLSLLASISFAQVPVTLEVASKAAGLNAGAQQRLLRSNIHLKKLAQGVRDVYDAKPSQKRLEKAHQAIAIGKKVTPYVSLELGIVVATELQEQLKVLSVPSFMEGFSEGYAKNIESTDLAAAAIVISEFIQQERMKGAEERLASANQFLAENAKKEGVIVTKSGLQYEVLQEGTGPKPKWADMVTVNYRHTKPGSDFMYDSAEHNHTETIPLRGAIPEGWRELFLLMNKGGRYRVYLSPKLGWGAEGNGDSLLPNEVLITEFSLIDIVPPPPVVD